MCGYHSIALSRLGRDGDFAPAVNFFVRNLQALSAVRIPDAFLNVNVPECAEKDIRGVRVVRQSEGMLYHDYMEIQPDDVDCWVSTGFGAELTVKDANTDVIMSEQGYVTITPLTVVRTCFDALDKIKFLEKLS